ncbi:MAG: bifunctional [glutamine synthetase] adenylyltransferase/[glutamine synthetase]-adenylyl-L-tyrosine phosphorylase [Actinomycetes bacterium]
MSAAPGRVQSLAARLARAGFAEPEAAVALVTGPALVGLLSVAGALDDLGEVGDPDLALRTLAALASDPAAARVVSRLTGDVEWRQRAWAVLGASAPLGQHLLRHPEDLLLLRAPVPLGMPTHHDATGQDSAWTYQLLEAVGADPCASEPVATGDGPEILDALRVGYRRILLQIAADDLTSPDPSLVVDRVGRRLAGLADATLAAALAVARAGLPAGTPPVRLAVIALGKCGAQELNYVSDVDVVCVAEPPAGADLATESAALAAATRMAAGLSRACSATSSEGTIWPVDMGLRPEGRSGVLVRTVASHRVYYERWASTWEFQALLKARWAAGDQALGEEYLQAVSPLVWRAAAREGFVADVQAMRRRVAEHIPSDQVDRELKLGPGGLRDVEFAVQLLQLVHGRADESLRVSATLPALEALAAGGYVGRSDATSLGAAYRFLRAVEHRVQLQQMRRTHLMPADTEALRWLGRTLRLTGDPVAALQARWVRHSREVRRLHERLFYRPLLAAVARLTPDESRLTPAGAQVRLEALGFRDPAGALRHIEALTTGVSRRAAIQRTLLPVMLDWFADAPDPDGGLAGFRRVSDALGATPWYLRLLRDEGAAAAHLALVLSTGRYLADLLLRAPEAVAMLADDTELVPRTRADLVAEMGATAARHHDPAVAVASVRGLRRRELVRIGAADVLGRLDLTGVGQAVADVTAATICAALDVAARSVTGDPTGLAALPTQLTVIAMGRLGGYESGYGSDADVLFVHDPRPGVSEQSAHEAAHAVAALLRGLLAAPCPDPPLDLDASLRPEGRQGPLVRTLESYATYYARWGQAWEAQALLRAEPLAGDDELAGRFIALVDPVRYPIRGVDEPAVRELRRIKARVEAERLPRGTDPSRHLKLGPGGLADVEWTVQLLQLRHAASMPGLRTTRTLPALSQAVAAGLVDPGDGESLRRAWELAGRIRNAVVLVRGRADDELPKDLQDLVRTARLIGYAPPASGEPTTGALVEEYRRTARRARTVVERLFYTS